MKRMIIAFVSLLSLGSHASGPSPDLTRVASVLGYGPHEISADEEIRMGISPGFTLFVSINRDFGQRGYPTFYPQRAADYYRSKLHCSGVITLECLASAISHAR